MKELTTEQKYKIIFSFAENFLEEMVLANKLEKSTINQHLTTTSKFENLNDANKRLIESLCNRQMMPSIIKFKEREIEFKAILFFLNTPRSCLGDKALDKN